MGTVDNSLFRDPGLVAAISAIVTLILTKGADALLKRSSFQLDDGAVLRKELMAENRALREEIRQIHGALSDTRKNLQCQIDALTAINHEQQHKIEVLEDKVRELGGTV